MSQAWPHSSASASTREQSHRCARSFPSSTARRPPNPAQLQVPGSPSWIPQDTPEPELSLHSLLTADYSGKRLDAFPAASGQLPSPSRPAARALHVCEHLHCSLTLSSSPSLFSSSSLLRPRPRPRVSSLPPLTVPPLPLVLRPSFTSCRTGERQSPTWPLPSLKLPTLITPPRSFTVQLRHCYDPLTFPFTPHNITAIAPSTCRQPLGLFLVIESIHPDAISSSH